jgi:uncharacterized membrane protein
VAPSAPSFEDYPLTRQEYIAAIVHLYRGELSRANVWRTRLDMTTNWAIVTSAGLLSYTFGDATHSHSILLLGNLLILMLLGYEARRFRLFDVWRARVRMIEENFYGPILRRDLVSPKQGWGRLVAKDLLSPEYKISFFEALRARLLRNYYPIFLLLLLAWGAKVAIHPGAVHGWEGLAANLRHGLGGAQSLWPLPIFLLAGLHLFLLAVALFVRPKGSRDEAYWPKEEAEAMSPLDV